MEFLGVRAQLPAELVWTWDHRLSKVPIEDAWVTTKLQGAPTDLAQWITRGTAIAVSDGSLKSGLGTAEWENGKKYGDFRTPVNALYVDINLRMLAMSGSVDTLKQERIGECI